MSEAAQASEVATTRVASERTMLHWRQPTLFALLMLPIGAAATTLPDISGQYRLAQTGMVVKIGTCDGGRICGRIVDLGNLPPTDANMRYLSVLFGCGAIPIAAAIARRLNGVAAGLICALLLALSPAEIGNSIAIRA